MDDVPAYIEPPFNPARRAAELFALAGASLERLDAVERVPTVRTALGLLAPVAELYEARHNPYFLARGAPQTREETLLLLVARVAPAGWLAVFVRTHYTTRAGAPPKTRELNYARQSVVFTERASVDQWRNYTSTTVDDVGSAAAAPSTAQLAEVIQSALVAHDLDSMLYCALAALYADHTGLCPLRDAFAEGSTLPMPLYALRRVEPGNTEYRGALLYDRTGFPIEPPVGFATLTRDRGTAGLQRLFYMLVWCPPIHAPGYSYKGYPSAWAGDAGDAPTLDLGAGLGGWWAGIPVRDPGASQEQLSRAQMDVCDMLREPGWRAMRRDAHPFALVLEAVRTAQGAGRVEASLTALLEP